MANVTQEKSSDTELLDLLKSPEKCDELPTKKSTRIGIYRQILLTVLVTPLMISLAHMLSYPTMLRSQLNNSTYPLYMDDDTGAWFTSVNSLLSPVGSLIAGIMMDRYGRKITLATPLIPLIISWMTTATATSHNVLFASRILLGIVCGFGPPVCQIYLAECADSELRGITINFGYVSLSAGFLLTFALGAAMNWRFLAWSGVVFPAITLIGLLILPETPNWLVRHDQIEKAYKNLLWLRGDPNIARNELNETLSRFNKEKETASKSGNSHSWRDFLQPSILKPIVIIFSFILLFNLTGTYLIIYYANDVFSQVNFQISTEYVNVALSTVRLIVTFGFCWLFMHIKRRTIYLIAGIGSTISTLALAIYLHIEKNSVNKWAISPWVAGSLFFLYVATNTGFLIAPGFLTGELLAARIRGRLAGYIFTYFSIVTFVLNKYFKQLNAFVGVTGILLVFGIASLANTVLIFFMIPETKGKSLDQIEQYFQTHGWIYKSKRASASPSPL